MPVSDAQRLIQPQEQRRYLPTSTAQRNQQRKSTNGDYGYKNVSMNSNRHPDPSNKRLTHSQTLPNVQ